MHHLLRGEGHGERGGGMIVIIVMWTKLRPVVAEKQCGRNKGGKIEQKKKCEIKMEGKK